MAAALLCSVCQSGCRSRNVPAPGRRRCRRSGCFALSLRLEPRHHPKQYGRASEWRNDGFLRAPEIHAAAHRGERRTKDALDVSVIDVRRRKRCHSPQRRPDQAVARRGSASGFASTSDCGILPSYPELRRRTRAARRGGMQLLRYLRCGRPARTRRVHVAVRSPTNPLAAAGRCRRIPLRRRPNMR